MPSGMFVDTEVGWLRAIASDRSNAFLGGIV